MSLISLGEQDDIGLPETAVAHAENEGHPPSCKQQADATKERMIKMRRCAAPLQKPLISQPFFSSAEIASRPARPRAFG